MIRRIVVAGLLVVVVAPAPADAEPTGTTVKFTEHLLKDKFDYAYGIGAGDLDGDGRIDLTAADAVRGELAWFANDGMGKFTRYFIKANEQGWFERHVIGDVNGDNKPDVVVVKNLSEELLWFENPGDPRQGKPWTRHVITTKFHRSYDVCLADLNGDGKPDVAASAWVGHRFAWFENPGKPGVEWKKHILDEDIRETRSIHAVDLNGDGRLDLVGTARVGNLVVWYENPGPPFSRKWQRHVIDNLAVFPTHGHPVDLDGDGDLDYVLAVGFQGVPEGPHTNQVVWYENVGKPGKGTEWKKHVVGRLESAFEAVAGDLNGDGKLDVAATSYGPKGMVVWFENPGDPKGKWTRHILKENWVKANQVLIVDLDKDGKNDIVAEAERGCNELRWWRNEGRK